MWDFDSTYNVGIETLPSTKAYSFTGTFVNFIINLLSILKISSILQSHFQLAAIIPLAVAHTLGNLLTNVSLGKVNVSFTHTIKAMEPFFTVLFSVLLLGEVRFDLPIDIILLEIG